MEAKSIAKGVRVPPRKARLVIDLIRGKDVAEADRILAHLNKEAARVVRKVLTSAVANAENNNKLNKENLYVSYIVANEGKVMKRVKAGPRGYASPIKKRTSHITVVVSERN
jgi:large subunit ribosomal protein L22